MFFVTLAMISGLWVPVNSILMKYIVDELANFDSGKIVLNLFWPSLLFVLNFEIHNLSWRGLAYISYKYQATLKNTIISKTFEYVQNHSHQFFQEHLSGQISSQIYILADNIGRLLHNIAPQIVRTFVLLIIAFVSMYLVHPQFFYGLIIWFFVFTSVSLWFSRRIITLSESHADAESFVAGQLVDSMTNTSTVRIFERGDYEQSYLQTALGASKQAFQTKEWFLLKLQLFQGFSMTVMLAFMLYELIELHSVHLVNTGDFALILSLIGQVGWTVWWTVEQVDELNKAVGHCKQSLKTLFVPQSIQDAPNAKDIQISKGEIIFSDVDFQYNKATPLFSKKNITIHKGQKVGLVGYSGSGKTTFVNLILRLYDINSGEILIDGQNIAECTQKSLRSQIAIIPQDPSLFQRSIMENIRYGKTDATDKEVIKASQQARADQFINACPEGYDSLVGERGIKLSGGQRQRIAIARAILKNAPILILDEATSQLDSLTESDIQDSLKELMENKTTLVIAHRLSTLLNMDRILVFDQGKIIEDGTHLELLEKRGLYKTLWETQVGGFLSE